MAQKEINTNEPSGQGAARVARRVYLLSHLLRGGVAALLRCASGVWSARIRWGGIEKNDEPGVAGEPRCSST